jgi:hypothetical protein
MGRHKGTISPEQIAKVRENGKKGGRPRRQVLFKNRLLEYGERVELPNPTLVLEKIIFYIQIQATAEEIANHYFISTKCLDQKLREHLGMTFGQLRALCNGSGKLALRITQFNQSKTNVQMSKHLGEMWLDQSEKKMVEVTQKETAVRLFMPDNGRDTTIDQSKAKKKLGKDD